MRALSTVLLFALASATVAGQIPDLSGTLRRTPSLSRFLKGTPPLTSGFDDTERPVPNLNRREWRKPRPMTDLPRTPTGGFRLQPGLWETTLQSFCLRPAAYGPNAGQGYLHAPFKGSRARTIQAILQASYRHPEIEQGQVQLLLWSVLSRLKVSEMRADVAATARALLSAADLREIEANALDIIPPNQRDRMFRSLPADVRKTIEVENDIRYRISRGNSTYQQIAELAVPGEAPHDPNDRLTRGEWSRHPDGYFIRYYPNGFSEMKVQILVPERSTTIRRDHLNRIIALEDAKGGRTETEYDDSVEPRRAPGDARLAAYAFKTIRLVRPRASGAPEIVEVKGRGWTFHRSRPRASRRTRPQAQRPLASGWLRLASLSAGSWHAPERGAGPAQFDWDGWRERAERAQEIHEDYEWYRERYENNTRGPSDDAVDELEDTDHYREGVDAALGGSLDDRLDWLIDHQERENAALEHATSVIDSLPTTSTTDDPIVVVVPPGSGRTWEPSGGLAIPSGGGQRLGFSGAGR